jgi:hypothetical protein
MPESLDSRSSRIYSPASIRLPPFEVLIAAATVSDRVVVQSERFI